MRIKKAVKIGLCLGLLASAVTLRLAAAPAASSAAPRFKHLIIVIFENTDFKAALAQPAFSDIAKQGALLTNYFAVAHPSLPNYVALISGGTRGVVSDADVTLTDRHIGDLLKAHGKNWKVYAEGYPGRCDLRARVGTYVRKHTPFLSFADVQKNPAQCAHVVSASRFVDDMRQGRLPNYALYIPDLNDDGHDTGPAYAAGWFAGRFAPLLKNPRLMDNTLLVLTFDEDSEGRDDGGKGLNNNRVYTVLYGDMVRPGFASDTRYSHYSLLKLAEDNWGLGSLGSGDAGATPISGIWK